VVAGTRKPPRLVVMLIETGNNRRIMVQVISRIREYNPVI
jgi:hypothetical protein